MTDKYVQDIKDQIREEIKREKKQEEFEYLKAKLRAEVEMEDEWNLHASTNEHRNNLNRWLIEVCDNDPQKYMKYVRNYDIPSVYIQTTEDPKDYAFDHKHYVDYSIYGYWKVVERDQFLKDKKKARWIVVACVAAIPISVTIYVLVKELIGSML